MKEIEGIGWVRICPACGKDVVHKTKAKCRYAEKHEKICSPCNRIKVGSANSKSEECPLCSVEIKTSRLEHHVRELERHASSHDMSAERLWQIKYDVDAAPSCACGCEEKVRWCGWKDGYTAFVLGHNARVETDEQKEARAAAMREAYASGRASSWSKGLTKDTDERVRARGEATSVGRKRAFDEGRIEPWSKGLTKDTDGRLEAFSSKLKKEFEDGEKIAWHKGLSGDTDERIAKKNENLSKKYVSGELTAWHKGLSKDNDERLLKKSEALKKWTIDIGFDHPLRLSLPEVLHKIKDNTQINPVDPRLTEYRSWSTRNLEFKCNTCGNVSVESIQTAMTDRCVYCNPRSSKGQREVFEFVRSLGFEDTLMNDRKIISPSELDIVVPSKAFAVEYNGLYWHSEACVDRDYHDKKSEAAASVGYSLFHVFEDEWKHKRHIVESMIKHRLGLSVRVKGGARGCTLSVLTSKQRREFFDANHVDGDVRAVSSAGLFDKDGELVAAASLRRPFHKKYDGKMELARFCSKNGTNVPGALARLTAWASKTSKEAGYDGLITYSDGRIGSGSGYSSSGWSTIGRTEPRFWWTDGFVRLNRFKIRADSNESEKDKANRMGFARVYGCGNTIHQV